MSIPEPLQRFSGRIDTAVGLAPDGMEREIKAALHDATRGGRWLPLDELRFSTVRDSPLRQPERDRRDLAACLRRRRGPDLERGQPFLLDGVSSEW